ncbi:hypothetical protein Zmor_011174 [Zophobas morio]|uniref:PBZ-type domain-containing protein n=1 Tax=Zophobas morio TaxID=2755281 RepID=A0AA38ISS8_9CUCU|nr:hypothetical protein Zmor_011174 [Zophobas morio]
MSESVSEYEKFKQDSRIPCRYGDKCYQKNPAHLEKYKHLPKKLKRKHNMKLTPLKKVKLDSKVETQESAETNREIDAETSGSISQKEQKKECISSSDSEQNDEIVNEKILIKDQLDISEETLEKSTEGDTKPQMSEQDNNKDETVASNPFNPKEFIRARFLVNMPKDFYDFWDFCKELKPTAPSEALKSVGLELIGPYDVLADKFKHIKRSPEEYLRHWRYYYDPPEVFAVIKDDNSTGYHIGYFYDSPDEPPVFLISNYGTKDGVFTKMGDNIFAALHLYLVETKKTGDPFKKLQVGKLLVSLNKRIESLNLNVSQHSQQMKERQLKVVAKTFNKIGLVVPYNKKTQLGYRNLAMEDKDLITLLNKLEKAAPEQRSKYLSDLQPVLTYANIALDECDFGTGIKLGWELLYHGIDSLNSTISQFLSNSYRLLNKEAFAKIAEAHMNKRKKGCNLSII